MLTQMRDLTAARIYSSPDTLPQSELVLASAYLAGDEPIPTPELVSLVEYCEREKLELIIGTDSNAHHTLWNSAKCNDRGEELVSIANVSCHTSFGYNTNVTMIFDRIMRWAEQLEPYHDPPITEKQYVPERVTTMATTTVSDAKENEEEDGEGGGGPGAPGGGGPGGPGGGEGGAGPPARRNIPTAIEIHARHKRKIAEITKFLENHYISTDYIYSEIQRIQTDRQVKDKTRKMVEYLAKPGKENMKAAVLKCYYDRRKAELLENRDAYKNLDTNNLVINVLTDPYNEGFMN